MNFFDQFKKEHIIIAHRGFRSIRAENTIEAFKEAYKKSDMFEFDVQFTKDFKPIVMHDDSLLRTTNVKDIFKSKNSYLIKDFSLKEIQKLDNSSWFNDADPFKTIKNSKVSIATLNSIKNRKIAGLDEVLSFIREFNFPANLEIKDNDYFSYDKIADTISQAILTNDVVDICIVSSFNHNFLKYIKSHYPQIKIAALFEKKEPKNLYSYLKMLMVDAYHIDKSLVEKNKIEHLKSLNIYTNVYTINSKDLEMALFKDGVKGIFTDYL